MFRMSNPAPQEVNEPEPPSVQAVVQEVNEPEPPSVQAVVQEDETVEFPSWSAELLILPRSNSRIDSDAIKHILNFKALTFTVKGNLSEKSKTAVKIVWRTGTSAFQSRNPCLVRQA
jgi:hypothetical protein